jgi:hypothetical protein
MSRVLPSARALWRELRRVARRTGRAAAAASGIALAVSASVLCACAASEKAAAKDPISCERDPSCARFKGRYPDCTKQCNDDPECITRCESVQRGVDTMGHP